MSSIQQAMANFGSLIDNKTGIIRSVDILKLSENDPNVFLAHAVPCDTFPLNGIRAANRGAACSAKIDRAIVRACGESIERYCSSFFDTRSMVYASAKELDQQGIKYVSTTDLYPISSEQYREPGFPFSKAEGRKIRWEKGFNYVTNESVYIPSSCVYVPYHFDTAFEPFTHMPISTGLAAGTDLQYCIIKGIMEIIERDALMLVWYTRHVCPRIEVDSCYHLLPEIDSILGPVQEDGPTWHINVLTLDVQIAIISAALINPGMPPLTSFGIAASQDPVHALLLALEEASLTRILLNRSEEVLKPEKHEHTTYNTLRDHMIAHATSDELRNRLNFLTEDGPLIPFQEVIDKYANHDPVEEMKKLGFEIFYKDITTKDVGSYGFHVVRTVIPGMQPLDNDHRYRYLGGTRIPYIRNLFQSDAQVNPDPHPFP